jgi:D-sedoheptulose 7-phosphate isomerase
MPKNKKNMFSVFENNFEQNRKVNYNFINNKITKNKLLTLVKIITNSLIDGKKLIVCGNGGSAADSQHFVAELVSKFKKVRKPLSAIALTTDSSIITSIANDFSFDQIFSKQIQALGKKGDVLIGISTSGTSTNVLNALKTAKKEKISTILLTGNIKKQYNYIDLKIDVPSSSTARIQEIHELIYHSICEIIEGNLV